MPTFNLRSVPQGIDTILRYVQDQIISHGRGTILHDAGNARYLLYLPILEQDRTNCPIIRSLDAVEIWFALNESSEA